MAACNAPRPLPAPRAARLYPSGSFSAYSPPPMATSTPRHVVAVVGGATAGAEAAAMLAAPRGHGGGLRAERPAVRQDRGRPAALARQAAAQGIRDHQRQAVPPRRPLRALHQDRPRRGFPRPGLGVGVQRGAARARRLARPAAAGRPAPTTTSARASSTRTRSSTGSTTSPSGATTGRSTRRSTARWWSAAGWPRSTS